MRTVTTLPNIELPTPPAILPNGNYGDSSTRSKIDRVIIHTMVGTVASANSRFCSYGTQVSAHYGVGLNGKLYHWLEETLVAYHAGDLAMNQRSLGVEHEDNGNYNGPRTPELYATSAKLVADICKYYGIPCDRQHILKHSEVIATGCPDALDIDRIVRDAYAIVHSITPPTEEMFLGKPKSYWLQTENDKATLQRDIATLQTKEQNYLQTIQQFTLSNAQKDSQLSAYADKINTIKKLLG